MRTLLRVVAGLVAAGFVLTVVTLSAFVEVSRSAPAQTILRTILTKPTRQALVDALRSNENYRLAVDRDLVAFELSRERIGSRAAELLLVRARANDLYMGKLPRDPGTARTDTGIPRLVTNQLNAERHQHLLAAWIAGVLATTLCLGICCYVSRNPFVLPAIALTAASLGSIGLRGALVRATANAPSAAARTLIDAWNQPLSMAVAFAVLAWLGAGMTAADARRATGSYALPRASS